MMRSNRELPRFSVIGLISRSILLDLFYLPFMYQAENPPCGAMDERGMCPGAVSHGPFHGAFILNHRERRRAGPLKETGPNKQGKEGTRFRAAFLDGRTDHPKDIFTIRMLSSEREEIGMENVQSSRNVGRKRECVGYWDCLFLATHLYNLLAHLCTTRQLGLKELV